MQKETKYTEDYCVNSIIFAFVLTFFLLISIVFFFSQGKPKKPVMAQKRGKKSTGHINVCCGHELMTCVF